MPSRALLAALCAACILLGVVEQQRTTSLFLPLRGCSEQSSSSSSSEDEPTRITKKPTQDGDNNCKCYLPLNQEFKAQSGQDQYLLQRVFFPQGNGALCCKGVFVEFGARDGITHSNTYVYEKNLGWKGLLFEVDAKEHKRLVVNRPNSDVVLGPVCPSTMDEVTIILSNIPGFTGTNDTYGTLLLFVQ
jgi:hypothetical protein